MIDKTDDQFLAWLAYRLVHVYGENPNTDFVLALKRIAKDTGAVYEAIHYPGCWDTAVYPSLQSALDEMYGCFQCHDCTRPVYGK